jgi:hypothetical protein
MSNADNQPADRKREHAEMMEKGEVGLGNSAMKRARGARDNRLPSTRTSNNCQRCPSRTNDVRCSK